MWKYQRSEDDMTEESARRPRKPKKTALMTAVDLLARQEHSEKKLREKLLRKGYAEVEVQQAIDRLVEMHYLNDADACARQFEFLYHESRSSVRQICVKLMQRGFESSLVKDCIPSDTFEREKAAALRVLALKFKPSADRQKMMANLYGKGFDSSAIRAAVTEFCQGEENQY
ncbi:regulatory protein RecX [Selenomonas sp. GACV-9]|uniref:regulatory protein RecX n=1 Tax=Selenomonas sp. GACV-9 TaxID=3158782 RepID=UPI00387DC097